MDGVPGLSFRGIAPGETFTYRFPVRQSGTYWYHSHSGIPGADRPLRSADRSSRAAASRTRYDRDYVVMLSDWTDEEPMTIVSQSQAAERLLQFRTSARSARSSRTPNATASSATVADRLMWGKMRMSPTDILDVTGATYTYLMNGQPPAANWTALVHARRERAAALHQRLVDDASSTCAFPASS